MTLPIDKIEAMTFEQIGNALGITARAAQMAYWRAVAKLRKSRNFEKLRYLSWERQRIVHERSHVWPESE